MPNYLEINKNLLFQSASSAGTTIVGVNGSDQLTVTDNNGVTTVVGQDWAPYTSSYKVCTSKLTQITEDEFSSGYLTIGKTYSIKIYNSGDDFSNVADVQSGIINTADCIFVATGTTPTNWTNASSILDSRYPVPTIDENTLGFTPYWKRLDTGTYYFNFSQSVAPDKIVPFVYPNAELNVLSTYEVDSQGYTFLDLTFNTSNISSFDGQVRALAAQPDGKVIVGGNFNHYAGETIFKIARLNSDGTLDTSFIYGGEGGFNNRVRKIVVQDDGKVLVGGDFTQYNDSTLEIITTCLGMVRLTSSGSVDPDFSIPNFYRSINSQNVGGGNVYDIAVQPDGKIIVGGWFSSTDMVSAGRIIRLDASGSVDATFDSGDGFSNVNSNPDYDRVSSVALQPDGNIICGGDFSTYGGNPIPSRITRLDSSGSLDATFNTNAGTGFDGKSLRAIAIQSDGKIVCGGDSLSNFNGTAVNGIFRLNTDGTLDTTFNVGGAGLDNKNAILSIAIQSDGKIVCGGDIDHYNGTAIAYGIMRLNSNGTLDTTFNTNAGVGFNSAVNTVAIQSDGKILCGGDFYDFNGFTVNYIARLNADGGYDSTFNQGTGFDGTVFSTLLDAADNCFIGGSFTSYNGTTSNYITRLDNSGSILNTFNNGFDAAVYTISQQADAKIVVGGVFNTYNKNGSYYITRLYGSYDVVLTAAGNAGVNNNQLLNNPVEIKLYS